MTVDKRDLFLLWSMHLRQAGLGKYVVGTERRQPGCASDGPTQVVPADEREAAVPVHDCTRHNGTPPESRAKTTLLQDSTTAPCRNSVRHGRQLMIWPADG